MEIFFVDSKSKIKKHLAKKYSSKRELRETMKTKPVLILDKYRKDVTAFWKKKLLNQKPIATGMFKSELSYLHKIRKVFNDLGEELYLSHCKRTNQYYVVIESDGVLPSELVFKARYDAANKFNELRELFHENN